MFTLFILLQIHVCFDQLSFVRLISVPGIYMDLNTSFSGFSTSPFQDSQHLYSSIHQVISIGSEDSADGRDGTAGMTVLGNLKQGRFQGFGGESFSVEALVSVGPLHRSKGRDMTI